MADFELLLFDLDGTLVDSAPDVHNCINVSLAEMGLPTVNMAQVRQAIGPGPKVFGKIILGDEVHRLEEFHTIFRPIYFERCVETTAPFPDIVELLQRIKQPKMVVTNKGRRGARKTLDGTKLRPHFSHIITRDEVEHPKPEPDMILHACELAGANPKHTLLLGDTDNDIRAANAAGAASCLATWGYSEHLDALARQATYSIDNPLELLTLIN